MTSSTLESIYLCNTLNRLTWLTPLPLDFMIVQLRLPILCQSFASFPPFSIDSSNPPFFHVLVKEWALLGGEGGDGAAGEKELVVDWSSEMSPMMGFLGRVWWRLEREGGVVEGGGWVRERMLTVAAWVGGGGVEFAANNVSAKVWGGIEGVVRGEIDGGVLTGLGNPTVLVASTNFFDLHVNGRTKLITRAYDYIGLSWFWKLEMWEIGGKDSYREREVKWIGDKFRLTELKWWGFINEACGGEEISRWLCECYWSKLHTARKLLLTLVAFTKES